MTEKLTATLLFLMATILIYIGFRFGVVGVRGGSVSREDSPLVFWLAMSVLGFGGLACLTIIVGIW
jgi:hypothetical protein